MIKLFAIICMFIDHFALILVPSEYSTVYWSLRFIGRLSMPLYAYCIARGCYFTVKKETFQKYLKNILLLAIMSQLPYAMTCGASNLLSEGLNICFAWAMSAYFIGNFLCDRKLYHKKVKVVMIIIWVVLAVYLVYLDVDYGIMSLLLPIVMYICYERTFDGLSHKEPLPYSILLILGVWVMYCIQNGKIELPQLLMILCVPLISFLSQYDSKVKVPKLLGYLCYPLSMVCFLLIRYSLN